jgi:hypothetical protein
VSSRATYTVCKPVKAWEEESEADFIFIKVGFSYIKLKTKLAKLLK